MEQYHLLSPEELTENVFQLIGRDWMLLTATDAQGNSNPMTASWGGMGVLWNRPVCFCFVRPQRHTHKFTEDGDRVTISFFEEAQREILRHCGRTSGREEDKAKACGLTPRRDSFGAVYYEEARLVLSCKKLYKGKLEETGFLDETLLKNYSAGDYHTVYVYEIQEIRQKKSE